MNLSEKIQSNLRTKCIVNKMERQGCILCLRGTPKPYLFIDLDLPGSPLSANDTRCDYLAFVDSIGEMPYVAPVEFKSTWRGKIVKQLQAGANEAERQVPSQVRCRFRPIGVIKHFPKGGRKDIRKSVSCVLFRDRSEVIRIATCGDKFVEILQASTHQRGEVPTPSPPIA